MIRQLFQNRILVFIVCLAVFIVLCNQWLEKQLPVYNPSDFNKQLVDDGGLQNFIHTSNFIMVDKRNEFEVFMMVQTMMKY